jgi:hypothetical protein
MLSMSFAYRLARPSAAHLAGGPMLFSGYPDFANTKVKNINQIYNFAF